MRSANIKNYCIALEALSHIAGANTERLSNRIRDLLHKQLLKEENELPERPSASASDDDEIPF